MTSERGLLHSRELSHESLFSFVADLHLLLSGLHLFSDWFLVLASGIFIECHCWGVGSHWWEEIGLEDSAFPWDFEGNVFNRGRSKSYSSHDLAFHAVYDLLGHETEALLRLLSLKGVE